MELSTYTLTQILDRCEPEFLSFLNRPNVYSPNGRSLEAMMEDRYWGDLSEWCFGHDTGASFSTQKYQDMVLENTVLYGENVASGMVEIKTIPRHDDTAATTAIQNYFLKCQPGTRRADFFAVYHADREAQILHPFGFYRRGFANAIEPIWRS